MSEREDRTRTLQESLARQGALAGKYSTLSACLLDAFAELIGEAGPSDGDADAGSEMGRRIFEYYEATDFANELEASLRLSACLHQFVLSDDPRVASVRPFYASVGGEATPRSDGFRDALRNALDGLGDELFARAAGWKVQTNETSRGLAWLLPTQVVGVEAAHLVELGAAGGLNLYANQRAYEVMWGDGTSVHFGLGEGAQFRMAARGVVPEVASAPPEILSRVGIDRNPVDLSTPEGRAQLEACVWGDQPIRLQRLREALQMDTRARRGEIGPPTRHIAACFPDDLPGCLAEALPPAPTAPVISFNTYVTAYLSDVEHRAFARRMHEFARTWSLQHRLPWMWVRFEPPRAGDPPAPHPAWCRWRVDIWEGSQRRKFDLGWAHPHMAEAEFEEGLLHFQSLRNS